MKIWTLGVIGLALGAATTANAVVMSGTFAGTITSGYASGSFGYDVDYTHAIDMTGKAISGTFTIDLDIVHGPCAGSGIFNGAYYNACYIADRGVRITQTIDGHQEVFDLTKSATPGPDWLYNMSEAGAFVDNLQSDQIIISTHAQIGDGYPVAGGRYPSVERKAGIAALLPTGTITDPGDLAGVEYAGSVLTTSGGYRFGDVTLWGNQTWIFARDDSGGITADTNFSYSINAFSIAVVPEPATWAMMIVGFGAVGASLRRRKADAITSAYSARARERKTI